MEWLLIIFYIVCVLMIIEILFRQWYKHIYKKHYCVVPRFLWSENYIADHPFLSFVYNRHKVVKPNKLLKYNLHIDKYHSYEKDLKINNMGHFGNDFDIEKKEHCLRVACLGDSTTANNIAIDGKDYSYPLILQKYLSLNLVNTKNIEVYNCGIGGWVSVDILMDFLLNIIRTKPDYIVFCHGFVDLHLYLMENFSHDYSHGRCNLAKKINKIKRAAYFPHISFWHSYEYLKNKIVGSVNIRDEVINAIRTQEIDINRPYYDLSVEKDIIKHIFIVCKYYGIKIIIGTYPFYNYNKTDISNKMAYGVEIENKNIKDLAIEFKAILVDQDRLIPKNDKYFLDWVHLTPEGMTFIAENYGQKIIEDYKNGKS